MTEEKTYNVGIYCRLSNDDERSGESVSIENQKLLLQQYVRSQGWNEIDVYIDDGYSGTNFNRPGVKRLIEDAKAKRINVILVKDLSRFGRNYIEFGQYTDYLFPSIGCRFIALNNGIDTQNSDSSNDVMCFLNLFNEFYSRDTSKKVKAVKRACAENGMFMGTYPPYGYLRSPEDKHRFVIDEETAPVVRRIFELRAAGQSYAGIAGILNSENILPPGALYYQRLGKEDKRRVNHLWVNNTIKGILENEAYIGNMVQGQHGTMSYKMRRQVDRPPEDWIRVEGTHQPIISKELWETVLAVNKKKVRKTSNTRGGNNLFCGLVYCADCGFKMVYRVANSKYKDGTTKTQKYLLCGSYARSGNSACTRHSIKEEVLYELVLADIREKAQYAEYDYNGLLDRLVYLKESEQQGFIASAEQELKAVINRLAELEKLTQSLYEDKCNGDVPQGVFQMLMQKYETERSSKTALLPELQARVKARQGVRQEVDCWLGLIRQYTELKQLDESILFELVDRIEVGELEQTPVGPMRDVKVVYRYVGNVDECLFAAEGVAYAAVV